MMATQVPKAKLPPPAARARQYQRTQIETASPTRLVVLLYDGAIRFCTLGEEALRAGDIETQNNHLIRAQRIIGELMGSLNHEAGGEVADNLKRVYVHMLEELVHANLYDKPEPIAGVVALLRDLRESWQALDLQIAQNTNAAPALEVAGV